MKKLMYVFALLLSFCFVSNTAFAGGCPEIIFYSKTANQKKEVFICLVNENSVYYSFGKVGIPKPEIGLWGNPKTVHWGLNGGSYVRVENVKIDNGNYSYIISHGYNDKQEVFSYLLVYKNDVIIANIKLDTENYINNIGELSSSNITMMDDIY